MREIDAKLVIQHAKNSFSDKEYELWLLRAQLQQLTQINTMQEMEIQQLKGEKNVSESDKRYKDI